MTKIERPGTANVGEFSPLNTPLETPEVVTTARTQAALHRKTSDDSRPTGSMTTTYDRPIKVTRK